MNSRRHWLFGGITALAISGLALMQEQTCAQENRGSQDMEVLTRGPVHEAFAGTISYDPVQGILISGKPPEAIEEIPPEQQLEGDNVVWIPGYWAWDEDQNDFIWISGIWRNLPPGRQWVPGYWSEAQGQYQWTSGYWSDTENTETSYLPQPPRSVEAGPNIEAPSDNYTWVPGNWMWRENRYAWRGGYWNECRPNWNYQPSCYRWTHRGYVYVDGYWDYPVASRGVVFAPVYFNRGYYNRPGFCYTPSLVVSLSVFTNHLFLRPNYGHYYFGDYYAPNYYNSGYYASYSYNSGRRGCDPIYAYQSWENRSDRTWQQRRREDFQFRRDHEEARPPHTWNALGIRPEAERARGRNFDLAQPLDRVAANRGEGRQRFRALDQPARDHIVAQRQDVRKFGQERQRMETSRGERPQNVASADRTKSQRSPIATRPSGNVAKENNSANRPNRAIPEQSNTRSGKNSGIRPQANGKSEQQTAGKVPTQPNRNSVPQPNRNFQPEPKRQAVSPPRDAKPSNIIPRRTETAPSRQAVPQPQRQQVQPQRQQVQPQRQQAQPQRQQAQPQRQQAQPQRQQAQPQRQQAQPQRQQAQPQRQEAQPQHQQAQPQRQQAQPQRQQAQPQRQQAQPQRQQAQPQRFQPAPQRVQARPAAPKQNSAPRAPQKQTEKEGRDKILRTI